MPEIQEKIKEKKSSEAHIKASVKSRKKAVESGKIKRFSTDINTSIHDIIIDYCTKNNINKAEFLRRIAAKIEAGTFEI